MQFQCWTLITSGMFLTTCGQERRYPNYLSGTAYVMHRNTISKLYKASLDTPIFHLEDIYITGVLSRKVLIKPVDNIGFSYVRRKLNSCLFKQTVTTHHVKHAEMRAIHNKLKSSSKVQCAPIRARLLREYGPGKCKWPKATGWASELKFELGCVRS